MKLHILSVITDPGQTLVVDWVQSLLSGGAGAALLYLVKKMVDGSIVWRPMAEILERAIVAIEDANERDEVYQGIIKEKMSNNES